MRKNKRNYISVRLTDVDYEAFLATTPRNYSVTVRELIRLYSEHYVEADNRLSTAERVKEVMRRV